MSAIPTLNEKDITADPKPLGGGTTATVLRATYQGATFAFKQFLPNTDNSVRRELAAAAKLTSHPSILTPLFLVISGTANSNDSEEIVGVLLELMPGSVANRLKTLATLQQQQQTQQQNPSPSLLLLAVRWALDLATGLEAAHQLGVLHGDIKPDNLLLTATDKLKITDLGSAHVLSTVGATTATGMRGTPLFMAPEHADGEPLTAACDVFSFGMTLWQMLHPAVTHPFGANVTSPMQISKRLDKGDRPAIDKQIVPPALEQLILRCWDGDPAKRPTITEAAVELIAIQQSLQPKPAPAAQQGNPQQQQQQQVSRPFACLPASFRPSGPFVACLEQLIHPSYRSNKMKELLHFHQHHSPFLRVRFGVSDDEALALTFYTMDLRSQTPGVLNPFQILNRALASRATTAEVQPVLPWIFHLHSAITAKLPATRCSAVYRGMKGVALSQSIHYAQGRHVWWPAFTSTTTQHATMIDFAASNGTLIIVEHAVGVDISAFSLYPESEVLLPPNSHFIVQTSVPANAAGAVLDVMLGPQTATLALQTAPRVVNADLIVLKQQPVTAQDSIVDHTNTSSTAPGSAAPVAAASPANITPPQPATPPLMATTTAVSVTSAVDHGITNTNNDGSAPAADAGPTAGASASPNQQQKQQETAEAEQLLQQKHQDQEKQREQQQPEQEAATREMTISSERLTVHDEVRLGIGSFSVVNAATLDGQEVAAKKLHRNDNRLISELLREAMMMRELDAPTIVRCYGVCRTQNGDVFLVTDRCWCSASQLQDLLPPAPSGARVFSVAATLSMMYDVAIALIRMHTRNLVHRDIKPDNLLISINNRGRLCAKLGRVIAGRNENVGTRGMTVGFIAPEIRNDVNAVATDKADIYALGTTAYFFLKRNELDFPIEPAEAVKKLLKSCMSAHPDARPTAVQLAEDLDRLKTQYPLLPQEDEQLRRIAEVFDASRPKPMTQMARGRLRVK